MFTLPSRLTSLCFLDLDEPAPVRVVGAWLDLPVMVGATLDPSEHDLTLVVLEQAASERLECEREAGRPEAMGDIILARSLPAAVVLGRLRVLVALI